MQFLCAFGTLGLGLDSASTQVSALESYKQLLTWKTFELWQKQCSSWQAAIVSTYKWDCIACAVCISGSVNELRTVRDSELIQECVLLWLNQQTRQLQWSGQLLVRFLMHRDATSVWLSAAMRKLHIKAIDWSSSAKMLRLVCRMTSVGVMPAGTVHLSQQANHPSLCLQVAGVSSVLRLEKDLFLFRCQL